MNLEYFLLRFLDLITHPEVPKLFSQRTLCGVVEQFDSDRQQGLGIKKFFLKFLDLVIHQEVP